MALQQQVQGDPENPNLQYQLGLCYSGACREHSMVSPELALEHLRHALGASRNLGDSSARAGMLNLLGITYTRSSTLPAKARLLAAIECYEKAADIYFLQSQFREWARMQFNIGNAWCEMPGDDCPGKWEKAILHYEWALLFRSQQDDPVAFAATLENMGTACRAQLTGDKAANVRRAIQCYRRALRISRADSAPQQWARLHNNLGNAYLTLPPEQSSVSRVALARKAIRHFNLALRVRTREQSPFDYGVTQMNRGQAYLSLGLASSRRELVEAANSFREAQAAFLQAGHPHEAATAARGLDLAGRALTAASDS